MFDLDDLIDKSNQPSLIKGRWCTIRFSPDTANGEVLNIGVAFKPSRGKLRAKLVSSASGFRSIYGSNGVDNFSFLLAVTAEHIQRTGALSSISPHITFSNWRNFQGEDVDRIIDGLFSSVVSLRIPDEVTHQSNRTFNTLKLRQNVIREMRRKHSNVADHFLHEQAVMINYDNRPHLLDLPLWQSGDLVSGRMFGSIVSAQYIDEIHRQHDLDRAFRNVDTAQRFIASTGKGALFVLRPASNDSEFPLRDILNDIDSVTWPLAKAGVHIEVEETTQAIQQKVANFLCA